MELGQYNDEGEVLVGSVYIKSEATSLFGISCLTLIHNQTTHSPESIVNRLLAGESFSLYLQNEENVFSGVTIYGRGGVNPTVYLAISEFDKLNQSRDLEAITKILDSARISIRRDEASYISKHEYIEALNASCETVH